ncbi:hypothetical protein PR002_g19418 [Phytophthora rubi]|uniref:Uncharacterized protein n=2 Tax=Phytophthora rubi TaxID=129364 RepID=A0A6A3JN28_9STRA|nr:hypothetical protein PR002_g19418 [Phytophthora rubi]
MKPAHYLVSALVALSATTGSAAESAPTTASYHYYDGVPYYSTACNTPFPDHREGCGHGRLHLRFVISSVQSARHGWYWLSRWSSRHHVFEDAMLRHYHDASNNDASNNDASNNDAFNDISNNASL